MGLPDFAVKVASVYDACERPWRLAVGEDFPEDLIMRSLKHSSFPQHTLQLHLGFFRAVQSSIPNSGVFPKKVGDDLSRRCNSVADSGIY